jgi:hypothetical protein
VTKIGPLDHFIRNTMERDPDEFTLVMGPLLALLTLVQFKGGIAEQISPITRWLSGQRFSMHPEGHKPKEPGGLKKKLRGKENTGSATAANAAASSASSPSGNPDTSGAGAEPAAESSGSIEAKLRKGVK